MRREYIEVLFTFGRLFPIEDDHILEVHGDGLDLRDHTEEDTVEAERVHRFVSEVSVGSSTTHSADQDSYDDNPWEYSVMIRFLLLIEYSYLPMVIICDTLFL